MTTRSLRFCFVTTFYPPYHFGGDGVFVYRLAHVLADRGHEVDVIHSVDAHRLKGSGEPAPGFPEHPNVRRLPLETQRPLLSALAVHQTGRSAGYGAEIREILSGRDYDVIHYHNVSLVGGPDVLRMGDAVKLYTTHEYWLTCPTHVLFRYDREACTERTCIRCTLHAGRPPQLWRHTSLLSECVRHVDRFLMPSRFAMERHRQDGLDAPMTVLPHFVPDPQDDAQDEAQPTDEPDTDRPFFLFVGRLEKLKGVQDLIGIFETYDEADLVIVGSGDHEDVLRQQAGSLGHVRFLGRRHPGSLGDLYRRATAVLVPSLCYEVFGLTAAEALMHGTPVIARRIGALSEIVEESGGGLTFDTPEECRAEMERLRTDPQLRRTLSERGRRVAQKRWSVDAHLDGYLDVVGRLLAERPTAERRVAAGG